MLILGGHIVFVDDELDWFIELNDIIIIVLFTLENWDIHSPLRTAYVYLVCIR